MGCFVVGVKDGLASGYSFFFSPPPPPLFLIFFIYFIWLTPYYTINSLTLDMKAECSLSPEE